VKEILKNDSFRIMQVDFPKGQIMPQHFATSDAFIMVEKGEAQLKLLNKIKLLQATSTFTIPANVSHSLEILADFRAFVVLAAGATIKFTED
jgi:quercetin dioxygenase-like cupin family protein